MQPIVGAGLSIKSVEGQSFGRRALTVNPQRSGKILYEMTTHSQSLGQSFASCLRVINPLYQAEKIDVRWKCKRVYPPPILVDQIRAPRHHNDLAPNWRCDKDQQLPLMPATHLLADRQRAKYVSYPAATANDHGWLSVSTKLDDQADRKRNSSTSAHFQTEKPMPPRP